MRPRWLPPLLAAGLLLAALPAAGHVHVCVRDGEAREGNASAPRCDAEQDSYHFVLGWAQEPPYAGVPNGLDLQVRWAGNDTNIGGLTTLRAEYRFGGATFPVEVRPVFGQPRYTADISPTRPGQYTVRVFGTVEGIAIDFTAQPETVDPAADIEFPPRTDDAALQQRVDQLEAEVRALRDEVEALRGQGASGRGLPGFEVVVSLGADLAEDLLLLSLIHI